MITSKQRSFLRSMAHNLDPVVYIGKFGVTENVEKEIDNCLENRELVKVKLQEGCLRFTENQRKTSRSYCRDRKRQGKRPAGIVSRQVCR